MNYVLALLSGEIVAPILIVVGLAALLVYLLLIKKKSPWFASPTTRALKRIKTAPDITTPAGHEIYYLDGVTKDISLTEVDRGIEFTFKKLECAGYPVDRTRHHVKIVVQESEQAPESKAWAIRVPVANGDVYYNSEWDMMKGQRGEYHYILAAEQMIAAGDPYGDVFVLPYVPSNYSDTNYLARACSYSMEHITLAYYDFAKFEATKTHTDGTGHPLIPTCPGDADL
jgi:hypothetical protein